MKDKPEYLVPKMKKILNLKTNGLKVVSTFAGCGGSSTGYKMAGFKILWANEFDGHAAECYRLNSETLVDETDIRQVKAVDVLKAIGLKKGDLDVLDGSPPCQTFSTAGKRKMTDKRSDLFFEYIRLLRGLKPKVFIAENVSGMIKGVAKGYFKIILKELKVSGYRVECRLLDAQWLGVPQQRQRVIFVGFRNDQNIDPVFPVPLKYRYSVRDACPWIGAQKVKRKGHGWFPGDKTDLDKEPSPTVCAGGISGGFDINNEIPNHLKLDKSRQQVCDGKFVHGACRAAENNEPSPTVLTCSVDTVLKSERRKFTIEEVKRICAFPDDFKLSGSYAKQWARLGNSVPPVMMFHIARTVADALGAKKGGLQYNPEKGWQVRGVKHGTRKGTS